MVLTGSPGLGSASALAPRRLGSEASVCWLRGGELRSRFGLAFLFAMSCRGSGGWLPAHLTPRKAARYTQCLGFSGLSVVCLCALPDSALHRRALFPSQEISIS